MIRRIALYALALFWVAGGVNHFLNPDFYVGIMPPYLPAQRELVFLSGVTEIIAGVGVIFSATRELAYWGIVAMLVAFLPVHVHMVVNSEIYTAQGVPYWLLWARFPVQVLFFAWAWWATRPEVR